MATCNAPRFRGLPLALATAVALAMSSACGQSKTDEPAESIEAAEASAADDGDSATWFVAGTSDDGLRVSLAPVDGYPLVGAFQQWHLNLTNADGAGVFPARIGIGGGMPGHGHGMPTQPQVTQYLGNGRYLVEGIKFNMAGPWQFNIVIETPAGTSRVVIPFEVTY